MAKLKLMSVELEANGTYHRSQLIALYSSYPFSTIYNFRNIGRAAINLISKYRRWNPIGQVCWFARQSRYYLTAQYLLSVTSHSRCLRYLTDYLLSRLDFVAGISSFIRRPNSGNVWSVICERASSTGRRPLLWWPRYIWNVILNHCS